MTVCVITKDALLGRFLTLELAEAGFAAEVCEAADPRADLYLCDLDSFTGPIPENAIGFSYEEGKGKAVQTFLQRPIDSEALQNAVKLCLAPKAQTDTVRDFTVDANTRRIRTEIGETRLSEKELVLLKKLCTVPLLTRADAAAVFGDGDSNVVDVYMHYLRKKLKAVCPYDVIVSKRGEGYALTGKVTVKFS